MNVVDDSISSLICDCSLLEKKLKDGVERELISSLHPDWPAILSLLTSSSRVLSELTNKLSPVMNSIVLCPSQIPSNRQHSKHSVIFPLIILNLIYIFY